jgi:hypothetical protein
MCDFAERCLNGLLDGGAIAVVGVVMAWYLVRRGDWRLGAVMLGGALFASVDAWTRAIARRP